MSGISPSPLSSSFNALHLSSKPISFSFSPHHHLKTNLTFTSTPVSTLSFRHRVVRCGVSSGPGGPTSGENESKNVLDAFFLGKALAEAVNERVASAVGEFLGTITRLQAEQQKQIQDFQAEVLERAREAKAQAAHKSTDALGIAAKPTTVDVTQSVSDGSVSATSESTESADEADASDSLPYSISNSAAETASD